MTVYPLLSNNLVDPAVYSGIFAPEVSQIAMAENDRMAMGQLAAVLLDPSYQFEMKLSRLYYEGLNIVASLGIAVPPELEQLRAILGWCATGVEARSERLRVLGFRMPDQTEVDDELMATWQSNNMDSESALVQDDAMVVGRSFVIGGVNDDGSPLLTAEAPEHMIGSWDVRKRELSAAFQTYYDVDPVSPTYLSQLATYYTRMSTIQMWRGTKGWVVQERNDHGMGFVPVRMFAHKPTIKNRYGQSAMNAKWRNTQDRACRTLVRGEVASEFWATLKIFILGAAEKDFKNSDGSQASAWDTFIGRISAIRADDMGNLPQIHEVRGDSPDGIVTTFDQQAKIMAGQMGVAPQYLGIFSDGNPASADAIRMSDFRLKTAADRLTLDFGNEWESLMRMTYQLQNRPLPKGAERMETDWMFTGIPTPNADAVTITTQMAAGAVPPTSDDALARMDWTPVERKRIAAERSRTQGLAVVDQAIEGLRQPAPGQPAAGQPGGQQPLDGQQVQAEAGLNAQRSTDNANAG